VKGFVPTPPALVDRMVDKLFRAGPPAAGSTLLDPGCGSGVFVEGVLRWCQENGAPIPRITAIDSDPARLREARETLAGVEQVTLIERDFLLPSRDRYDFIIGNPPYVSITGLDADERTRYRERYRAASGRFDLYLLFFEQALDILAPDGRLVFVTPEKYLYVQSAREARRIIAASGVEEVELIDEQSFPGLVTYPAITTVARGPVRDRTRITARDGTISTVALSADGSSWLAAINGAQANGAGHTLEDVFVRISCGVATGADEVFVLPMDAVPPELVEYAVPTLSGRELTFGIEPEPSNVMLVPYGPTGELLAESQLGPLSDYLGDPGRRARLERRTCVARKPWYAFHETPPLADLRRPKILCKDITARPWFVADESGEIVPRHSVYYLVPSDPSRLHELCDYLNSDGVVVHLKAHCQRAANGFLRLQSHVLKRVPLPSELVAGEQLVGV
jgi:SAM-dependent methyltransferase